MAHSCGLQLMLAVDWDLSWVVKLASVYIWPLCVVWTSRRYVGWVLRKIIRKSSLQKTCGLGSCKASHDLALGISECHFYCILLVKLVTKGRPDSKKENWSLPLDVRSSTCISRGKESTADILETFYYRLSWGRSPKYHYKWVTICSLQLHMFSQLIFTTTNNKIGIIIFPLSERTKMGSKSLCDLLMVKQIVSGRVEF